MSLIDTLKFIVKHPLTQNNKFIALGRFLKWQIGSRLVPYPVVYPFVGTTKLVVEKGMTGATGNIYTGLHEFSDMGFLLHFLREDDLFVDIGANIGSYSILASGVCRATSIAIEPSTVTFRKLLRNVRINNLETLIKPLNIGLGGENTIRYFTKSFDTINHIVADSESVTDAEEVQINTLDTIIGNLQQVLVLKIDVEGFESEVLRGARSTLNNDFLKAVIIELNGSGNRYGFNEVKINEDIQGLGFRSYEYDPLTRKLREVPPSGNGNTIYIRDLKFILARINESPKIDLLGIKF